MRRAKIVCTLGPATDHERVLRALIHAGMDVARINFSHGTQQENARRIETVRRLAAERKRPLAVLQDLSGPKLRVGEFAGGRVHLRAGATFTFTTAEIAGDETQVCLAYPDLLKYIKPGERLVLGDGLPELRVTRVTRTRIEARVTAAGDVRSQQGFNAPETHLPISAVTEKDLDDLALGIEHGVDWIAMSFVRGPEDLQPLRDLMRRKRKAIPIISKIERHEAIRHLDAIIAASDGIMVARGDLGVELPVDRVPILQKTIIRACNAAGKPVITATQMLESMIQNRRPTRAEVTDIANAILDGTDAVMLSGETAVGKYPVQAVRMMARVATQAERAIDFEAIRRRRVETRACSPTDAISEAACSIAEDLGARVIISSTSSGYTARMVSKNRPRVTILGATDQVASYRRLALVWGVYPVLTVRYTDTDQMLARVIAVAKAAQWVKKGDVVVVTAGHPVGVPGHTNLIKVATVA